MTQRSTPRYGGQEPVRVETQTMGPLMPVAEHTALIELEIARRDVLADLLKAERANHSATLETVIGLAAEVLELRAELAIEQLDRWQNWKEFGYGE